MQDERRADDRMPDGLWTNTVARVRGEFDEMPCLSVTPETARVLFGLPSNDVSSSLLERLEGDGFLARNPSGEYARRHTSR
jgi:hypothetical protein